MVIPSWISSAVQPVSSPTGVADAFQQGAVVDVTRFQERLEILGSGGPHGAADVPANGAGGACFSRNSQSGEGCTSQQASGETRKHGTTNKHVNKKLALSIRNADTTQLLKSREKSRELSVNRRDT